MHAQPMGDFRGTGKMKSVSNEAKDILKLFEEFFGPYPYDRLDVTQMATGMGFGQAPPGLLFLTGEAFISSGLLTEMMSRQADRTDSAARSPYFHDFFAHEIAHQWFGHDVLWGRDGSRTEWAPVVALRIFDARAVTGRADRFDARADMPFL